MTTGKRGNGRHGPYSPEALAKVSAASRARILRVQPWTRIGRRAPSDRVAQSVRKSQYGAWGSAVRLASRYADAVLKALEDGGDR